MRSDIFTVALLLFSTTPSLAAPQPVSDIQIVAREDAVATIQSRSSILDVAKDLWKRKGGGGGGGKGGGGGSSGGTSGGKGGGSTTGSGGTTTSGGSTGTSAGKGGTGSSGKGAPTSNTGGSTKTGSGVQPNYGGGKYYGGGAKSPYQSGGKSPLGVAPVFLGAAALGGVGALGLYGLYGAYSYPYHNPYTYHNRSARRNQTNTRREAGFATLVELVVRQDDTGANETKPVDCLCAKYASCGCDDNGDTTFLDSLIGDGSYDGLNKTLVNVLDMNGTSTIVLNGTLPNGTTVADPTSTENADGSATSASTTTVVPSSAYILQASGFWVLISFVSFSVYFM